MDRTDDPLFQDVLARIAERATGCDLLGNWPGDDLTDLAAIGATGWAVPAEFGGADLDRFTLQQRYESLAAASLATALAFTQRDAAVGFIEAAENDRLKADLLPKLARNEVWTTIGISHLTTSTQPGALTATPTEDGGILLDGTIPWATGAAYAAFLVAAARVPVGHPVVFMLPTNLPGVTVRPAMPLTALSAAHTSAVDCQDVRLTADQLLTGPSEDAMGGRTRSVHIGQAFAAIGLTVAALNLIGRLTTESARTTHFMLAQQLDELRRSVHEANTHVNPHDLQRVPILRSELNSLALRATQAAVTLYKGTALRMDHPAQRLAREALFLLVWSSPSSVVDRNLELLAG